MIMTMIIIIIIIIINLYRWKYFCYTNENRYSAQQLENRYDEW